MGHHIHFRPRLVAMKERRICTETVGDTGDRSGFREGWRGIISPVARLLRGKVQEPEHEKEVGVMKGTVDLELPDFPISLLPRIDRYAQLLEEANPGLKFNRTACVTS